MNKTLSSEQILFKWLDLFLFSFQLLHSRRIVIMLIITLTISNSIPKVLINLCSNLLISFLLRYSWLAFYCVSAHIWAFFVISFFILLARNVAFIQLQSKFLYCFECKVVYVFVRPGKQTANTKIIQLCYCLPFFALLVSDVRMSGKLCFSIHFNPFILFLFVCHTTASRFVIPYTNGFFLCFIQPIFLWILLPLIFAFFFYVVSLASTFAREGERFIIGMWVELV